jgi:predicted dehydrogenase
MKVVLVGLGEAGAGLHLPALAGLRAAEVAGACDTDPARREHAATRFRVPVFDDLDAMIREARPGLVIVATPPDAHAAVCERAFAAGADVLCEKPMAATLAEADRVLASAAAAGRRVAVNHQFREMPIFQALVGETTGPAAEPVLFAQVWQSIHLPPGTESGWRGRLRQRAIFDAGVHLIDLAMALFGEKPASVQASVSDAGGAPGSDAVALVTLEFSGGRLAQVTQNRISAGARHYCEVRADTRTASLRASFGGRSRLSAGLYHSRRLHVRFERGVSGIAWREIGDRRTLLSRNPGQPLVKATRAVIERTIEAFRTNGRPPTDGALGRDVLEVAETAYRSAAAGERLRLDRAGARQAGPRPA